MTEDEAKTVGALAAQCAWGGRERWGLIMRYGQLFTPGTDAGGGAYPLRPRRAGRNAYRKSVESGLLYAEAYSCAPGGTPAHSAWCLDGETVVDPGSSAIGTAYFGVALRPDYMRRTLRRSASRTVATGSGGCSSVLMTWWTRRWILPRTSSGTLAGTFRPGSASGL